MGFLRGGGEAEGVIRSHDWSTTPLGPIGAWPDCLRAAVGLMLPATAQIVLFWGPDHVALYNDAYARIIGDRHPRALGRPARENWSELWWSDLEPFLRHVLQTGEAVAVKDRPVRIERNGYSEEAYFDSSYSPICDEDGVAGGVLCIVSETTTHVLEKRALREREEQLHAMVAHAINGIALTDAEGRFVLVNGGFSRIVGYSEAELLGMRIRDITHSDDLPDYDSLFGKMIGDGVDFVTEKRYVRKDGSLVWVSNSVGPIRDEAGRVTQASLVIVDITERKLADEVERRLASIIESSDDAILSTDLDMIITSWNQGAERLYGYTAEEAIGKPVTMLVPGDRPGEEARIIERIRLGGRVEPHETKRLRKDGSLIDVSLTVSPVYDEHGGITGASKIAHDITARKESERLQRVLMGEMKHRVKNVLATVQAIARQTFGRDPNLRDVSEAFEARLHSLARAHDLASRERWDGADLSAVIEQVLAPYRRAQFEISGPPLWLSPRVVLAISLGLHELATNAAKYGALSNPNGCVVVTWVVEDGDPRCFSLRWQEREGPPVTAPQRKGFGFRLIEAVLSAELNGTVEISLASSGLVCVVHAQLDGDGVPAERPS